MAPSLSAPRPSGQPATQRTSPPAWLRVLLSLLLLAALVLLVFWPRPAWGDSGDGTAAWGADGAAAAGVDGARLFEMTCAGCHPQGGNIIRRGRTLKLGALERQGIGGPAAIAAIAATGVGRMDGYAAVLGEGGPEAVGAWVWQQAQAGWPRPARPEARAAD